MPVVFDFWLEGWTPRKISRQEATLLGEQITKDKGEEIALGARDLLTKWLSRKHKFNIGYTDGASRNFIIKFSKPAVGRSRWEVIEGNQTHTNKLIREGIKSGHDASISDLRKWAAVKIGTLYKYGTKGGVRNPSDVARLTTVSSHKRRTKGGSTTVKEHGRSLKHKSAANSALYAIKTALKKEGTFREGSNWYQKSPMPKGIGRFDYPQYLADRNTQIARLAQQRSDEIGEVLWDYLRTGTKSYTRRRAYLG